MITPVEAMMEERERFEVWVKSKHPERWPNPHTTQPETFIRGDGMYYNFLLQAMWDAWQAAQS